MKNEGSVKKLQKKKKQKKRERVVVKGSAGFEIQKTTL